MAKKANKISAGGHMSPDGQSRTIVLTATKRERIDISSYLSSVKIAENVDFPNRCKLYDMYANILLSDGHLAAVMAKRKAAVLNQQIEFRRRGKVDERIQEQLRSPWFFDFLSDLLDTTFYGHSLFQFFREGDWINYFLIPRKHVDPQRHIILRNQSDLQGIAWEEFGDLLFAGKERDLGLFARIMPYAIYKRNCLGDWVQYAERFGQPLVEGEYEGYDEEARRKMNEDLFNLGSAGVFVHPKGTTITIHESAQKSGSSQLFKELATFCNEEISKIVLGNTLTTQASATGTQALGTVQKTAEESINDMDRQMVLNVLNFEFSDILRSMGFNMQGGEFAFVQPNNTDLKERIAIDVQLVTQLGVPVADDYFYERYGIEKPKDYEALKAAAKPAAPSDPTEPADPKEPDDPKQPPKVTKQEGKLLNALRGFFGRAPEDDPGALDW